MLGNPTNDYRETYAMNQKKLNTMFWAFCVFIAAVVLIGVGVILFFYFTASKKTFILSPLQDVVYEVGDTSNEIHIETSSEGLFDFYQMRDSDPARVKHSDNNFDVKGRVKGKDYAFFNATLHEKSSSLYYKFDLSSPANVYLFNKTQFESFLANHSFSDGINSDVNKSGGDYTFKPEDDAENELHIVVYNPSSSAIDCSFSGTIEDYFFDVIDSLHSCNGKSCTFDGYKYCRIIARSWASDWNNSFTIQARIPLTSTLTTICSCSFVAFIVIAIILKIVARSIRRLPDSAIQRAPYRNTVAPSNMIINQPSVPRAYATAPTATTPLMNSAYPAVYNVPQSSAVPTGRFDPVPSAPPLVAPQEPMASAPPIEYDTPYAEVTNIYGV